MSRLTINSHEIEISNEDKVLYPGAGITKGEYVAYYQRIADTMLPHMRGRLITMRRFPHGIEKPKFYQKSAPEYFPDYVNRVPVDLKEKGRQIYITCENKETLVYLANLAVIPHVWTSRVDRLDYPDRLIFDMDPPESGGPDFEPVRYAALIMREILKEIGLEPSVMGTGSRGAHVVVPLDRSANFGQVKAFARRVAQYVISLDPEHFTLEYQKKGRGNRLFIDIFRNDFAQTAVAPYAAREHPGAPVAAPVTWNEFKSKAYNSRSYDIKSVFRMLKRRGDPWKGIFKKGFSIVGAGERLKKMEEAPAG